MKLFKDFGVRALYGAIIIGSFAVACFYGMIYKPQVLVFIKDCMLPPVLIIIGFYFGQRSVQKGGD